MAVRAVPFLLKFRCPVRSEGQRGPILDTIGSFFVKLNTYDVDCQVSPGLCTTCGCGYVAVPTRYAGPEL
jgi:hypothetical protein